MAKNTYLAHTNQLRDQTARILLEYYLAEKAFVCASVSILYDNLPERGLYFLDALNRHVSEIWSVETPGLFRTQKLQQWDNEANEYENYLKEHGANLSK